MNLHGRPDTQPTLEAAEIVINDVTLDHTDQFLPAGEASAVVPFPLEDPPEEPSMGPLSMHFPTRDMLCVMPAAASLSWKI